VDARERLGSAGTTGSSRAYRSPRSAWIIAALTTAAAIVLPLRSVLRDAAAPPPTAIRFAIRPPANVTFNGISAPAISPDGHAVAFVTQTPDGVYHVSVRAIDSLEVRTLPGTDDAVKPFWSPDSHSLAFFMNGKLRRSSIDGGLPQVVCDAENFSQGGAWNADGVIVFAPAKGSLVRVASTGGEITPATALDTPRHEVAHAWPVFLPDGRHFLYEAQLGPTEHDVLIGSLESNERIFLLKNAASPAYAAPGRLLFWRDRRLMVQSFDTGRLRLNGAAAAVTEEIGFDPQSRRAAFSLAVSGAVAYQSALQTPMTLTWVDRTGRVLRSIGPPGGYYMDLSLSFDDERLAVNGPDPEIGTQDIWLWDLRRDVASRFTAEPGNELIAVWSPDGQKVAYTADARDLYVKSTNGTGMREVLLKSTELQAATDWSSNGQFVLFQRYNPTSTGWDVWALPLSGARKPFPVVETRFDEMQARVSPNGRWLSYTSNESGRREIYVQPFPPTGQRWQISNQGGAFSLWRRDGRELFYIAADGKLMAIPVRAESTLTIGEPIALFQTEFPVRSYVGTDYVVSRDGQRFLLKAPSRELPQPSITVVLNWISTLKQ
jgi:Tol biopolymer transport system component